MCPKLSVTIKLNSLSQHFHYSSHAAGLSPYYLARQFFVLLEMMNTVFIRNAGLVKGLVTPYEQGLKLAVRWNSSLMFSSGSFARTKADLARWTPVRQMETY